MSKGGTDTVESSSDITPRYRQFADENLVLAGTIANNPYVQFQGSRVAGLSGDEGQAFGNVRDMANSGVGQAGANALGGLANYGGYTSQQAQAGLGSQFMNDYQNPYTDQVVNQTINDAGRANAINQNQAAAGAAMQGALGGSGAAILAAENNRNFTDTVARESGQLRNLGFTNAAQFGLQDAGNVTGVNINNATRADQAEQFKAQTQLQAAQAAAGLGMQTNDALANAGNIQRGIDQAGLNTTYGDFIDQQNYPLTQLGVRQSALGQTPVGTVARQPVSQPGLGSALGGIGGLLGGIGALGGTGGISSLFCWVAREVYGDDPKWLEFRSWMLNEAPDDLHRHYALHGESIAREIADKPELKALMRGMMDTILEAA